MSAANYQSSDIGLISLSSPDQFNVTTFKNYFDSIKDQINGIRSVISENSDTVAETDNTSKLYPVGFTADGNSLKRNTKVSIEGGTISADKFEGNVSGTISNALTFNIALVSSQASSANKDATMAGFELKSGYYFYISFNTANSYKNAMTLRINSNVEGDKKTLYINNAASGTTNYTIPAGLYLCHYDGSNYQLNTHINYAVAANPAVDRATTATKLQTARKTYVTLGTASTTTTRDWSGDTTIPVDGTLAVGNGGTGQTTFTSNSILTGNGTSAIGSVATNSGAAYATSENGALTFGALPIAQGGTGASERKEAFKNLTNEQITSPNYVVSLTNSWAKAGYSSLANLKTAMSLNNVNNTADANKNVSYADSAGSIKIKLNSTTASSIGTSTSIFAPTSAGTANQVLISNGSGAPSWTDQSNITATPASHTHSYAGSSEAGGAATSANKLNTNAGSATNPVYFSGGIPKACTYSLNKTVPSDAKFTDTVYAHPTTSGYKHIPSGGSSGQILKWSADGTAYWGWTGTWIYLGEWTPTSTHSTFNFFDNPYTIAFDSVTIRVARSQPESNPCLTYSFLSISPQGFGFNFNHEGSDSRKEKYNVFGILY